MAEYSGKIAEILNIYQQYHDSFYGNITAFKGPSLHFHKRALETRCNADFIKHLEYIYATLASWGMHRMGPGGSKMRDFNDFKDSTEPLINKIKEAQQIVCCKITEGEWILIEEIFKGIKIMSSGTSLVGNSKVMAHMMPNIIPPIDREYTLRYLNGNTNIKNDLSHEWSLMKKIIREFFIPIASDKHFVTSANLWIANQTRYPWDTSIMKVIDNLVIGLGVVKRTMG